MLRRMTASSSYIHSTVLQLQEATTAGTAETNYSGVKKKKCGGGVEVGSKVDVVTRDRDRSRPGAGKADTKQGLARYSQSSAADVAWSREAR